MPPVRPTRLPLGRTPRRLPFELRVRLWLAGLGVPAAGLGTAWAWGETHDIATTFAMLAGLALGWWIATAFFFERLVRPLQTLTNVVAALREDDFSFRARGAQRGDTLGDLAFEINALAGTLQTQRSAALDALALLERVLGAMQSPVLAFDGEHRLRLSNAAAQRLLPGLGARAQGLSATALGLEALLATADEGLYPDPETPAAAPLAAVPVRWSVRRAAFRLHGVPHTLLVLTDVAAALREEERLAWQRLIRVLSHEINNSLAPIQSIAGSLRGRLAQAAQPVETADLLRGLGVIEERSGALNRFLQAYQQLARLPPPVLRPVQVAELAINVARLETRLGVTLIPGPACTLLCDPDQIAQALINLLRNAADAALAQPGAKPEVSLGWHIEPAQLTVEITDNGAGIANPANLFVPFYTTKAAGSGIGLVLAQQIAAAHRGTVTIANREAAAGCVARLMLPL